MLAVNFITNHKLGSKLSPIETVELAIEINVIKSKIDRWIVFHSVKDFQPDRWRQLHDGLPLGMHALNEDSCYLEIEEFATAVLELSACPREKMESFLSTNTGKVIGTATWKLDMPVVESLGDLTELQLTFMVTSLDKYTGEWRKEGSGKIEDVLKKLNFKPQVKFDDAQVDLLKRLEGAKKAKEEKK
jgi:hypothetical protein